MVQEPGKEETKKIGPPASVAAGVQALAPRAFRNALAVRLIAGYAGLPHYISSATRGIWRTTAITAVEAFDGKRLIGGVACVFIAFHAVPAGALFAILAVAALALIWRDGHIHPPEASAGEAGTDGLILGGFLLLWQFVCVLLASPFTAPWPEFLVGLPFAMAMAAGWRFIFNGNKKPEPERTKAEVAYTDAWRINLLWFAAVIALIVANTQIVPVTGHIRDRLYGAAPVILLGISHRLQSDRIGGGIFRPPIFSIFKDPRKQQRGASSAHLFSKRMKTWSDFSWPVFYEGLFFVSLAFPICSAGIGVLIGLIPVASVHWLQFTVNAGFYIILVKMWVEIKKINEKVALALLAESK